MLATGNSPMAPNLEIPAFVNPGRDKKNRRAQRTTTQASRGIAALRHRVDGRCSSLGASRSALCRRPVPQHCHCLVDPPDARLGPLRALDSTHVLSLVTVGQAVVGGAGDRHSPVRSVEVATRYSNPPGRAFELPRAAQLTLVPRPANTASPRSRAAGTVSMMPLTAVRARSAEASSA